MEILEHGPEREHERTTISGFSRMLGQYLKKGPNGRTIADREKLEPLAARIEASRIEREARALEFNPDAH